MAAAHRVRRASTRAASACGRRTGITRNGSRITSCPSILKDLEARAQRPFTVDFEVDRRTMRVSGGATVPGGRSARTVQRQGARRGAAARPRLALHLRQVRRRPDQPVRPRGGPDGGGRSRLALEPAVHLRRRRPGQDPPAARDRPRDSSPAPRVGDRRASPARSSSPSSSGHDPALVTAASMEEFRARYRDGAGRAAGRRHPVPVEQGQLAGRVLPHLQRAPPRAQADRPDLATSCPPSCRASRIACAAASPGASSPRSRPRTSRPASPSSSARPRSRRSTFPTRSRSTWPRTSRPTCASWKGRSCAWRRGRRSRASTITLELADEALAKLHRQHAAGLTIEAIQREVASYFDVKLHDLKGPKRHRAVAHPRMIAMYLARKLTTMSYPEIGSRFGGKDHSTVISAVRKIERLCTEDPTLTQRRQHPREPPASAVEPSWVRAVDEAGGRGGDRARCSTCSRPVASPPSIPCHRLARRDSPTEMCVCSTSPQAPTTSAVLSIYLN